MTQVAAVANTLLADATVLAQVAVVLIVLALATRHSVVEWIGARAVQIIFFLALAATALSLFYSEVIGYPPCTLCWWQRVAIYPQVVLMGFAWRKGEKGLPLDVSMALSAIGGAIALYQYYGQMFNSSALTCAAGAASCAERFFVEFGYITIPMMSLTASAFMLLVAAAGKYVKEEHHEAN